MSEMPAAVPTRQLVGALLEHLARRLRTESESEIEKFGLRPRHFIALTLLRDAGERQQADLAGMLRLDPTNVVGLLNELEDAGLVERRRSAQDRRRHTVILTPAGAERLADVENVLHDVERRTLGSLDDHQHAALYQLLQQAAGDAVVCSEPAAPSPCLADEGSC